MDIEELTAVLGDPGHAPEPDAVMAALGRKRRRRARQRWSAAGGCLAAAAVIAAVAAAPRAARNPASPTASAGPAQHVAVGTAGTPADACTPVPLPQRVADAVRSGGSVVTADVSAAGTPAGGREPVVLRDVRTLRGPRMPSSIRGYAVTGFTGGSLRGQVFAIVLPARAGLAAPMVLAAPVSGGTVRFGAAGCWGTADTPLTAVEGLVAGK